ncbi:lytic transglycosylase domain-containing protein [Amycolatopsis taiwanensis]|uniref:lytic transglycosylase domain-containing protein n=1 Tax=Amycolatopsis taiwanensis TaxID=342230 RepID=UPI0004B9D5AC|nr:lytic murein transglycosylase [Amycolatopsis taiwanensis]
MSLRRARIARRKIRRIGLHYRTLVAVVGGVLAVLPALVASGGAVDWASRVKSTDTRDLALIEGFNPEHVQVNVDGSLPQALAPSDLPLSDYELPAAYVLPGGLLGIPATVLTAYHNAADILSMEQPNCHLDWALLASIGRIESNHARGGYIDKNGKTLEPILGPQLNGAGGFAAIPDTDHGLYDSDQVWDRAVGPMQFIPSTWRRWGADGNSDGISDPNNIFDATLAAARYLCAGGADLANPDQLRAAILRYNNSAIYLAIVLAWADAYRNGVLPLPDSPVPIGAPGPPLLPAPPPVAPPVTPPPSPAPPPPGTSTPPSPTDTSTNSTSVPSSDGPDPPSTPPTCPTTSDSSSTTTTTTTTTPPTSTTGSPSPCEPPGASPGESPGDDTTTTTVMTTP